MDYNEALKIVQAGKVGEVKDLTELRSGISALYLYFSNYHYPSIKAAIESFENEISRRIQHDKSKTLHDLEMTQGQNLHGETKAELKKLKGAVDRLASARCVDKWILVAGWIAAIGAAIAAWIALFPKH